MAIKKTPYLTGDTRSDKNFRALQQQAAALDSQKAAANHTHPHGDITDWGSYIDQAVKIGSAPAFAGITANGYIYVKTGSNNNWVQFWKDATPTYACSIGMQLPGGGSLVNDLVIGIYSGSWAEAMRVTSAGQVGIGTSAPNELLTVEGRLSLKDTTTPSVTSGYGKLYTRSDNGALYFRGSGGVEQQITLGRSTMARGYRNGTQTRSSTGWLVVQLANESYDLGSNFDTTNYRYVAPVSGYYQIHVGVKYLTVSACRMAVAIYKNGSTMMKRIADDSSLGANVHWGVSGSDILYLAASDYIDIQIYADAANGYIEGGGEYDTHLAVRLVEG